jgi:hypothetical protein
MLESREARGDTRENVQAGPGQAAPRPRLRWIATGRVEEVDMGPGQGPRLIPMRGAQQAAELASLILEALDRAAEGADRVHVSRHGWQLFLDRPAGWHAPHRPLSAIVGGSGEHAPARRPGEAWDSARDRAKLRRRAREMSEPDRRLLSRYREHRRTLAGLRRRVERSVLRQGDRLRLHRRVTRLWAVECAAGLVAAIAGAGIGPVWLLALGAAGFCVGAGGFAVERLAQPASHERQRELETRLARVTAREDQLETRAREVARKLGFDDPGEAAAEFARLAGSPRENERDRDAVVARMRSMAARLDLDGDALIAGAEDPAWNGTGPGWPPEVAGLSETGRSEPADQQAADRLAAAARLVERIQRELPAPWPLVVWDPWPELTTDSQAAWLLCLSREVAPRPVLAVISRGRG